LANHSHPFVSTTGEFFESKLAVVGFFTCLVVFTCGALAPVLAPQDPYDLSQLNILDGKLPPLSATTESFFILGTDDQGRDLFSAILYGLRISMVVGFSSCLIAFAIGLLAGLIAAYRGGLIESVLMRATDISLGIPAILTAIILIAIFGQGIGKIVFALVFVQWAGFARTTYGVALAEKNKEYLEAARSLTLPEKTIIFSHLLPNCLPPLIVLGMVQIAVSISLEATLSFLGVGLPVTEPSLGLLIANGYQYMFSGHYWISLYPGFALLITIVGLNLAGDRLRDVLNPRLKK
jgi:peptide/nickel transport system permease protein